MPLQHSPKRSEVPAAPGALASLALVMLLPSLGTSIANIGLPAIGIALVASFRDVQWVVLAYLLVITCLTVSAGRLGDLIGRRRLLLWGIALFALASLLCALAPTLSLLIAARALQGLGAAVMMALAMALVGATVPKNQTGRAMGLLGTMSAVGTTLGPVLGGVLIARFGWPSIFVIKLPLALLAWYMVQRCLPPDYSRSAATVPPRFDHVGTVLLVAALGAYALAMTRDVGYTNLVLLSAAIVLAWLFVRFELTAPAPLLQLAMLRAPVLRAGLASNVLMSTVLMATLVVGPFYLAGGLGLGIGWVGAVMAAGPLTAAVCGVPAGRMVDRAGTRSAMMAGLLGTCGACLALALIPPTLGVAGYCVPLVFLTASYSLFQAANNTAVMGDIAADQRGVVSGLLSVSRNLGLITGASLMGAIFALGAGDVAVAGPAQMVRGLHTTFGVGSVLLLVALVICQRAREVPA